MRGVDRVEGVVVRPPPSLLLQTADNVDALHCRVRCRLEFGWAVLTKDSLNIGQLIRAEIEPTQRGLCFGAIPASAA
jgi:hypothetical protein